MKLSLVFPAYNEAASIGRVLADFSGYCLANQIDHEIIVVNDGSRDATRQAVLDFANTHSSVRLIDHSSNQGYGAALRSGFAAATGNYIFFTDSDGQFQAADLTRTLPLIDEQTMVIGYRQSRADPGWRRLNAALWGRFVGLILGLRVRDLNCAWKLFSATVLSGVQLVSDGAFISAELLSVAKKKKYRLQEIPIRHYQRQAGWPTGAHPRVIGRAFWELAIYLSRRS